MNKCDFDLQQAAGEWYSRIRSVSSFTESDCEEYKSDMLDMAEELNSRGLDQEEAFIVASRRFREILSGSQELIREENEGWLQIRRMTVLMSGILAYFFFFYFIHLSAKLFYFIFVPQEGDLFHYFRYVVYYIISFHFLFAMTAATVYFKGEKFIRRLDPFVLKPMHAFFAFFVILSIAVTDHLLERNITDGIVTWFNHIQGITCYTFPFVFISAFLLLYQKYFRICFFGHNLYNEDSIPGPDKEQELENILGEEQIKILKEKGLNKKEILLIGLKRQNKSVPADSGGQSINSPAWRAFLIMLSGIMLYLFASYFFQSTARILFSSLQLIKGDANFSIRWTWFYAISLQMIFLFFITSLLIRDINLISRLKKIKVKPVHAILLFVLTNIFGLIYRFSRGYARSLTGQDASFYYDMEKVFVMIQYSFPLIISAGYLLLYFNYYNAIIKKDFR